MIQWREITREACRNTKAGVTKPLLSALLFIALIGTLTATLTISVVHANQDADSWRQSGASTQIVTATGHIDGERCESLAAINGITASGALRNGQEVQLAALPSISFTTLEATPGLAQLLGMSQEATTTGVWVSSDLATTLGTYSTTHAHLVTREGDTISVAGTYPYTEDGRLPILAYNLINPVPVTGTFDACWLEIWSKSQTLDTLLTYPLDDDATPENTTVKVQQLNSSMGTSFTTRTTIPTWIYLAASILIGGVLGIALTRTRRLELAGTLHAGIDKASLCLQTLTEYLIWSLPTLALLCAGILYLATANNPDPPTPAFLTGAKTLLTAWTTELATTILTTTTINENQLFTYFKNR